ncbi:hypothetical protein WJX84_002523 [Apatococcus fuscideae]|uniref:Uncharacterized protein n=1 Tax=Apatococcus fuscideae TaxID=2026836 RepID=A0AAW1SSP8_9CHLO
MAGRGREATLPAWMQAAQGGPGGGGPPMRGPPRPPGGNEPQGWRPPWPARPHAGATRWHGVTGHAGTARPHGRG